MNEELRGQTMPTGRRGSRFDAAFLIAFALGVYALYSAGLLIKGLVHSHIDVRFDFEASGLGAIDLGGHATTLSGLSEVTVSTGDLAPVTLVFLLVAKFAFILTLIGAAIAFVPIVRSISRGDPFTSVSLTALSALSWIIFGGVVIDVIATGLGSNLAARDLGITDEVGSSISLAQTYIVLGAVGILEMFRRSFITGRRAQEELEGLV